MQILNSAADYRGAPCAVAMGMFDGMHMGHRTLIERTRAEALKMGAPLVVYTYAEHPLRVLRPEIAPATLMRPEEKARIMAEMGVDAVVMNRFTPETAQTPAEEFLRSLCRDLKPVVLAAGFNHSFGYKGQGNADMLRKMAGELGYKALILEPVERDGGPVSSSRIRMLLQEGRFQEAERLLGREE